MVLRRIFGSKTDGVTGHWRKLHKEELHVFTTHHGQGVWQVWGRREMHTEFLWGSLNEETTWKI
jgi:hypothetical protein